MPDLFLWSEHEAAGARPGEADGVRVPRHYGDPALEYQAAVGGLAMADSGSVGRLRVSGRSPGAMLNGILTNHLPPSPEETPDGILRGEAVHAAVLTPKGRIVTDLRVVRQGDPATEEFLLLVPAAGVAPAMDHFARVLPPRLARVETLDASTGLLTFLGPLAPAWLAREAMGLRVDPEAIESLPEGGGLRYGVGDEALWIVRNGALAAPAWDLFAHRSTVEALWRRGVSTGAQPVGFGVLETLRVEAGRPALGRDLDETTIPTEAGLDVRTVDHSKGCYTGQEVIVRIRDRGHVNRHLRGLVLGEGPAPAPGVELHVAGGSRPVGRITSVVDSPRAARGLALAWVRREVEVPGEVRVGSPEGVPAEVRELPTARQPGGVTPLTWAF